MAREKKGFKQTQVKEKTGIHNKTLSGYENGVSEPDVQTLNLLSDLYDVSMDWLYGKTDNPQNTTRNNSDQVDDDRKYLIDKIMNASKDDLPDLKIIVDRILKNS